jgi:hypothetical protein
MPKGKPKIERRGGYRPGAGRKPNPRHHAKYEALGDPPLNGVAAIAWTQRMVLLAFQQAACDPGINEQQRRGEMRQLARTIASLTSYTELHDADQRIQRHAADMDDDADPEITNVPPGAPRPLRASKG